MNFYRKIKLNIEDECIARLVGKDIYSIVTDDEADLEVRMNTHFDSIMFLTTCIVLYGGCV